MKSIRKLAGLLVLAALCAMGCQTTILGTRISVATPTNKSFPLTTPFITPASILTPPGGDQTKRIVCAEGALNVRAEPDPNASIIGAVNNGEEVRQIEPEPQISSDGGSWLKVIVPNNVSGWVNQKYLCAR